jgi:hypothetical protein
MGLDACVYCDCLEKGRLRNPLPKNISIKVEKDGYPVVVRNGEEIWADHPGASDYACEHERRQLLHHRLGNISLVGLLRAELSREASGFPLILQKVVYNGTHAGDWLGLEQIPQLQVELERLGGFKCVGNAPPAFLSRFLWSKFRMGRYHYTSAKEANAYMQNFRTQMIELVEAALTVRKPISF